MKMYENPGTHQVAILCSISLRKAAWSSYKGSMWENRRVKVSSGIESSLLTSSRNHYGRFLELNYNWIISFVISSYQVNHFKIFFVSSFCHQDFLCYKIRLVCGVSLNRKDSFTKLVYTIKAFCIHMK